MLKTENSRVVKGYRWLLLPFGLLYGLITGIRNLLYNKKFLKGVSFDKTIINIGNLRMGGTGKSPMIAFLAEELSEKHPLAILSRGYGRKSSGFRFAGKGDNAGTIGDEPFQFYRRFGSQTTKKGEKEIPGVVVAVGEDRVLAIPEILSQYEDRDFILLDDAYQHRAVLPDLNILMTTFQKPFYRDWLFPVGLLRESRQGGKRADMVIVSNCPANLSNEVREKMRSQILKWTGKEVPVFFTSLEYLAPEPVWPSKNGPGKKVVLVSGIANSKPFELYLDRHYQVLHHFAFPDHYVYGPGDIQKIKNYVQENEGAAVITTEKDAARIADSKYQEEWKQIPLFYVGVKPIFLDGKNDFLQRIESIYNEKQSQAR